MNLQKEIEGAEKAIAKITDSMHFQHSTVFTLNTTIEKQGWETGCAGGLHGKGYSATKFTSRTGIHIHIVKNEGCTQHSQHTSRISVQTFL